MKIFSSNRLLLFALGIFSLVFIVIPAHAQDARKVRELQRVTQAQQQRLEMQQKQLDEQRLLIQTFQAQIGALAEKVTKTTVQAPVEKAVTSDHWAPIADVPPAKRVVTSGQDRVKLSVSGWVNRAVNIVDDGKDIDAYFVDNDNAESRVNFRGTANINDDLTLGAEIELTIGPDKAGSISQINKEVGDVFDQRKVEATLESKRLGKLYFGKGFTASYGTGTRDLSKTSVISYATVADTAGGMLFRQEDDGSLTNIRVVDAFQTFDGLNRRSRVRYDTPTYNGFQLSTSLLTDQKYDAGLWWGGQGYGFKAIGAAGFANPKTDGNGHQYDGSFSILHERTGLNLSLSTGLLEHDYQPDSKNYYAKIGWITDLFSVGETAFAIDYNKTENQPAGIGDGYSSGIAAVQFFEKYGAEAYFLYRVYSLDRDVGPEVDDIKVVSVGTRVRF